MIIIPQVPDFKNLVEKHFHSPSIEGHDVIAVARDNDDWHNLLRVAMQDNPDDDKEIFTFGFDHSTDCTELSYAIYTRFINRAIWCVPVIEDPDRVQYMYKQMLMPHVMSLYNAEPYISYASDEVDLYYNSVCHPASYVGLDIMIKKFGDVWRVKDSEYESKRMRNVKNIVCSHKIHHVFDVGSYLGYLDDLLEVNGVDVYRTDICPEVLKLDDKANNLRSMNVDRIAEEIQDCVLFASVLFAYSPDSGLDESIQNVLAAIEKKKPAYIVYEDSVLNFPVRSIPTNKWIEHFARLGYFLAGETQYVEEAVETFYGKKNIRRHGSVSVILKHFGAN